MSDTDADEQDEQDSDTGPVMCVRCGDSVPVSPEDARSFRYNGGQPFVLCSICAQIGGATLVR